MLVEKGDTSDAVAGLQQGVRTTALTKESMSPAARFRLAVNETRLREKRQLIRGKRWL